VIGRRDVIAIGMAALALTILNAWKPVVVDDTAYLLVADQIAQHPGDPYGFDLFWREVPESANQVLAPPVLPYWIAAAMALVGDHLVLWKLSLLPFALLLALAVHRLGTRLAPGRERLLLLIIFALPGVLAGFNLMTDVPALALGLFALSVAVAAIEGRDVRGALFAGLIAGVAMQTKYTAVAPLAVAAFYGLLCREPKIVASMLAMAGFVFMGWEGFVLLRYGDSHLSLALAAPASGGDRSLGLSALGLLCLIGGTAPAIGLLGLSGLRVGIGLVAAAAALICFGILAIALLPPPPSAAAYLPGSQLLNGPEILPWGLIGLFVLAMSGAIAWKILRSARDSARNSDQRLLDLLALGWVGIELVLILALAPYRFLAARRLLGLIVAMTFLSARATSNPAGEGAPRGPLRVVACLAALFGLLFYVADFADAAARRDAVAKCAEKLASLGADPGSEKVFFAGHWTFQFYAEQRGYRPVVAGESHLEKGDWLLIPLGVSRQGVALRREDLRAVTKISGSSAWPWSTIPGAYIGMLPLRRQPQRQVVVAIFRVERNFVASGSEPAGSVGPGSDPRSSRIAIPGSPAP
jgi:hypothetical protein